MWRNTVKPDRPQLTLWCKRVAGWIPEDTNTYTEYVTFIAFLLEQWLDEGAAILSYTYIFLVFRMKADDKFWAETCSLWLTLL
jgi:hypothetical protein